MDIKGKFAAIFFLIGMNMSSLGQSESNQPDNSKQNKNFASEDEMNAEKQGSNEEDLRSTATIRRTIVERESLSTYAKNAKVITNDGRVTLIGPVRNVTEKQTLEQIATKVVGWGNVRSYLKVMKEKE